MSGGAGGGAGGGGYNGGGSTYQPGGYMDPQAYGAGGGQSYGGANGAGGYNPQSMSGWGGLPTYTGVPPGWAMTLGSSTNYQQNQQQGQQSMPQGTPDWITKQMGDYYSQPFVTDPMQYGRWNWATNMQGGGVPSAFGQYAQQFANYPQLQFPPPPQPPSGGTPTTGPVGPGSGPQPPTGGPTTNDPMMAQVAQAKAFGYNSPQYQQLMQQVGGQDKMNELINSYAPGGAKADNNYWNTHSSPLDYGYHLAGGQWVK